jgi:hypothetical protein
MHRKHKVKKRSKQKEQNRLHGRRQYIQSEGPSVYIFIFDFKMRNNSSSTLILSWFELPSC